MTLKHSGKIAVIWLIFLLHSLLTVPVPGVNEPHYLCKARAAVDPAWCDRDFFLQSQNAHFCFYWLTGPFTLFLPFSTVAVGGRVVSHGLIAWGWVRLCDRLGLNGVSAVTAALMMLILSSLYSLSGEWIIGGFEAKVPAWGLGFAAVAGWLNGRSGDQAGRLIGSGMLLGGSVALHPVVGGWFVVAVAMAECGHRCKQFCRRFERRSAEIPTANADGVQAFALRECLRNLTLLLVPCLLLALPGLIPAVRMLTDDSVSRADRHLAGFIQVFWRLKHHLDPTEFPASAWIQAAILLAVTVSAWFASHGLPQVTDEIRAAWNRMGMLLAMALLVVLTGVAVGWHTVPAKQMVGWEWRASLLKFYPFRLADGLLLVMAPLAASIWLQIRLERFTLNATAQRSLPWLIPVIPLAIWLTGLSRVAGTVVPAGYTAEQYADWVDACDWIRQQTPANSLFLTPRESFAFKWFAERSEYVNYKDCPQDSAGILEWNRRLWFLHHWTRQSSVDGIYDLNDLRRLRDAAGIDYILTRTLGPFGVSPAYQGRHWQVIRVPALNPDTVSGSENRN